MEKSSFFNSRNKDRLYKAEDWAEYFATLIGNGIFPQPSNNLQVLAKDKMTVVIKAGKAWINGYFYVDTSDLNLTLATADGVLNRIDRVVVRWDLVERHIRIAVKKGTYSERPRPPALQRDADAYELALGDIAVNRGAVQITQANITDNRYKTDLCGLVVAMIQQLDITAITAQFDAFFAEYKEKIQTDYAGFTADCENFFALYMQLVLEKYHEFLWAVNEYEIDSRKEYDALIAWFNSFKIQATDDFNQWFDGIKGLLNGDIAGNLALAIEKLTERVERLEKRVNEIGIFQEKAWLGSSFLGTSYLSGKISEEPDENLEEGWLGAAYLGTACLSIINS